MVPRLSQVRTSEYTMAAFALVVLTLISSAHDSLAAPCADLVVSSMPSSAIAAPASGSFALETQLSDDETFTVCLGATQQLAVHGVMHTGSGRTLVNTSSVPGLTRVSVTVTRAGGACDPVTYEFGLYINPAPDSDGALVSVGCPSANNSAVASIASVASVPQPSISKVILKTGRRTTCPAGKVVESGFCKSLPNPVPLFSYAGGSNGVVVMSDQSVWTFGLETHGGNGPRNGVIADGTGARFDPAPVSDLGPFLAGGKTVVDAQTGSGQGVVQFSDGSLVTWGYNHFGTLGRAGTSMPGLVTLSAPVASFSLSSDHHVCAVLTTGALKCWGVNTWGQLGRTSTTPASDPNADNVVVLPDGLTATDVVTGAYHSHVLLSDATVASTGLNDYGQIGRTGTTTIFGRIPGLTAVTALGYHMWGAYAIKAGDNTVWGWGRNYVSTLGIGNNIQQSSPVQITSLDNLGITRITAGYYGAVAVGPIGSGNVYVASTETGIGLAEAGTSAVFIASTNLNGAVRCTYTRQNGLCDWPDGTIKGWGINNAGNIGVELNSGTYTHVVTPETLIFNFL